MKDINGRYRVDSAHTSTDGAEPDENLSNQLEHPARTGEQAESIHEPELEPVPVDNTSSDDCTASDIADLARILEAIKEYYDLKLEDLRLETHNRFDHAERQKKEFLMLIEELRAYILAIWQNPRFLQLNGRMDHHHGRISRLEQYFAHLELDVGSKVQQQDNKIQRLKTSVDVIRAATDSEVVHLHTSAADALPVRQAPGMVLPCRQPNHQPAPQPDLIVKLYRIIDILLKRTCVLEQNMAYLREQFDATDVEDAPQPSERKATNVEDAPKPNKRKATDVEEAPRPNKKTRGDDISTGSAISERTSATLRKGASNVRSASAVTRNPSFSRFPLTKSNEKSQMDVFQNVHSFPVYIRNPKSSLRPVLVSIFLPELRISASIFDAIESARSYIQWGHDGRGFVLDHRSINHCVRTAFRTKPRWPKKEEGPAACKTCTEGNHLCMLVLQEKKFVVLPVAKSLRGGADLSEERYWILEEGVIVSEDAGIWEDE